MYYTRKQTPPKINNGITIAICLVVAFAGFAFGLGQREQLQMERYAAANNCKWVFSGTFTGTDKDQVCI